jgi:hypothetical protein
VNISLERAVDYLKIRGLLEANQTQKFLMMYTMSASVAVIRNKEASKGGEEKRKEKKETCV